MDLNSACELLKTIMKHSAATDEFRHVDLRLVSPQIRPAFQLAIKVISDEVLCGKISKEDVQKKLAVK